MQYNDRPVQIEERWWKVSEMQKVWPAAFLREREATCVSACDRFLNADYLHDSIWLLSRGGLTPHAVLMHSRRTLFPVLGGLTAIPAPAFLKRFLLSTPVRAVQGLSRDVSVIENVLVPLNYTPAAHVDYYLMVHDGVPDRQERTPRGTGLTVRPAHKADYPVLFEMQMDYEMEEVVINKSRYNPQVARASLDHIFAQETMLVAEHRGKLVGKINTNARSFTCRQIGGVYVKPPYRRRGIATAMITVMVEKLTREGNAPSLFVRTFNKPAILVYKRAGFRTVADYRISYMA